MRAIKGLLPSKGKTILLIILTAIALLLLLLGVFAGRYLNSNGFRERIIGMLNADINGVVSVAGHRISLPTGRVILEDLSLTDRNGTVLARIQHIKANLSLLSLLKRTVHFESATIDGADVKLLYGSGDTLLLQQVFSPSTRQRSEDSRTEKSPWRIVVDNIAINQSRLDFDRPARQWQAAGRIKHLAGRFDSAPLSGDLEVVVDNLVWQQPNKRRELKTATAAVSYNPGADRPVAVSVTVPEATLSAQGDVDWRNGTLRMDADATFDLAGLASWIPGVPPLTGGATAHMVVKGDMLDPDVDLQLALQQVGVAGVLVPSGELDIGMRRRQVAVKRIQGSGGWGKLSAHGSIDLQPLFADNFRQQRAGAEALQYALTIEAQNLQLAKIPFPAGDLAGTFNVKTVLNGRGVTPATADSSLDIQLQARNATDGKVLAPFNAKMAARLKIVDQVVTISDAHATVGQNKLVLEGLYNLSRNVVDARATLEAGDLSALGRLFKAPMPTGAGKLKFACKGALASPVMTADLYARDLAFESWTFGRLLARARTDTDGNLHIDDLMLENQGSLIEGSGTVGLMTPAGGLVKDPALQVTVDLRQLNPVAFNADQEISGAANGRIALSGTLGRPVADVTLDASFVQWRSLSGRIAGKARWDGRDLRIADLQLEKDKSRISLQGTIALRDGKTDQWRPEPVFDARASVESVDLKNFLTDLSGTLTGRADLKGPVSNLSGSIALRNDGLAYKGEKIAGALLDARLEKDTLRVDQLKAIVAEGQSVTATGWYRFDRQFQVSLDAGNIDIGGVRPLQKTFPVEGRLTLQATGAGSLDSPDMTARLTVSKPRFNGQLLDDFLATAQWRQHRLRLDADLNFKLSAAAQTDTGDFQLVSHFEQTDLSPYLGMLAGAGWSGQLSGRLDAAGNWTSLAKTQGSLTIKDISVSRNQIVLLSGRDVSVEQKEGMLTVPPSRLQLLEAGSVALSATGDVRSGIRASLDGRIPLAGLAMLSDTLAEADGDIVLHASASGPMDNPDWRAHIVLEKVGFVIPGLLQQAHDVNGRIQLSNRRLSIDSLDAGIDSGKIHLSGDVALERFRPVDGRLTLKADAVPLQWPDSMDLLVGGELQLSGRPQQALLGGNLVLLDGLYYKDIRFNLLSAFTETKRAETVPVAAQRPQWMQAVNLDIGVRHRHPFLVDNNLARMQIEPDLKVGGTLATPQLLGRASVKEGEVIYRRKSFAIKHGVVDFLNPSRIEPSIDIVSQAQIRQWLITLSVRGTPDKLALTLDSNPPLEDNDILSLILWGGTNKEIANGGNGTGRTTEQMLAALIATSWGEDIKRAAGVDILEVDTGGEQPGDSADTIQVTVGKELSRRLTVKYSVQSGQGEMVQRAVSEYKFLERLIGSGFQDSKGDYGGELLFRIEFR